MMETWPDHLAGFRGIWEHVMQSVVNKWPGRFPFVAELDGWKGSFGSSVIGSWKRASNPLTRSEKNLRR